MKGILSGIRVLDITEFLAGPFATMLLADLGAEVIKIEAPDSRSGGKRARYSYEGHFSFEGETVLFLALNRNKKSVVIDLKTEAGKQVLYELVKKVDVVYNNLSPAALPRLGIDFETLKKLNPALVYCSQSTFGQTGPYRDRPGYDPIVQALGGGMSLTGSPGMPPVRAGIPIGDLGGGLYSVIGILAACLGRQKTGKPVAVDVGMLDCQISLLSHYALYPLVLGVSVRQVGTGSIRSGIVGPEHVEEPLYRAYETKDRYIVIALASGGARFWSAFCKALGREELEQDPRFNTVAKRWENGKELEDLLQGIFSKKTTQEWLEIFLKERIPCAPVNTMEEALSDPQVLYRNMVATINMPSGKKMKAAGNPIKIEGFPDTGFSPPPKIGEHTSQVLSELLGYSAEKIEGLKKIGAIG